MSKHGRSHDAKGKSIKAPRFIMLAFAIMETLAFVGLSSDAVVVLLQLLKRFNGSNNGQIAFGVRSGTLKLGPGNRWITIPLNMSRQRIAKALLELEAAGFIACTIENSYGSGLRHVREWRLTWIKCNRTGQLPTRDFEKPEGHRSTVTLEALKRRQQKAAKLVRRRKDKSQSRPHDTNPKNSPSGVTGEAAGNSAKGENSHARGTRTRRISPARVTHILTIPIGGTGASFG